MQAHTVKFHRSPRRTNRARKRRRLVVHEHPLRSRWNPPQNRRAWEAKKAAPARPVATLATLATPLPRPAPPKPPSSAGG